MLLRNACGRPRDWRRWRRLHRHGGEGPDLRPEPPYAPGGEPNREVAVAYYSRSGHSEAAAREIARTFNALIARINADYPRDFSGQRKAVSDARAQALLAVRSSRSTSLGCAAFSSCRRPTSARRRRRTHVEQAEPTGKEVVRVTTGNSRFEQADSRLIREAG